jgi:outer membrane protein OmpA-like peptidoglycan-associated protein
MKHLQKFENYKVDEGWKENVLVGLMSLFGSYAMGQKSDRVQVMHQKVKSESAMKSLLKQGWSLDSTQVDTLWSEVVKHKPDAEVKVTRLTLDKDQFFPSGIYTLTDEMKQSLDSVLNQIMEDGGVLAKVEIESSTDKQGLSIKLQNDLKSKGFEPNNKGLSKARSSSVSDYLLDLGINISLLNINEMSEQGELEIEQSARYVTVDFYYVVTDVEELPAEVDKTPKLKTTYYLSKINKVGKPVKLNRGRHTKTKKLGPIKNNIKIPATRCWNG